MPSTDTHLVFDITQLARREGNDDFAPLASAAWR
jgi:hypothetical protein